MCPSRSQFPKPDVPKIVVKVDPPAPPLDDGRKPIFRRVREAINAFNVAVLCIVAVSAGFGIGVWRMKHNSKGGSK